MSNYKTMRQMYPDDTEQNTDLILDIQSNEQLQEILNRFPIVVVDVWAPFCNPCRMLTPKYMELAQRYKIYIENGQIAFLKDNIEQNEDIHRPLVSVIPTFFIYINGQRKTVEKFSDIDGILQNLINQS